MYTVPDVVQSAQSMANVFGTLTAIECVSIRIKQYDKYSQRSVLRNKFDRHFQKVIQNQHVIILEIKDR